MKSELITWLDVERKIKESIRTGTGRDFINAALCFSSGMEIEYSGDKERVVEFLLDLFGGAFNRAEDDIFIVLDIANGKYPVELIESDFDICDRNLIYPLWKDQAYLGSGEHKLPVPWEGGPRISAFHSFKGGVGRTTSLMTYASAALEASEKSKILLIDGDLEAPGITFWLDGMNTRKVSFVNFLEAVHYSQDNIKETIDYFGNELRKTSISIEGNNKEIFVLPSALSLNAIMDMPITPEHIAKNVDNPWVLSDYIRMLGIELDVDLILIDLRAGLSELSSPLIFDPRIEHFFVTTIAKQSVIGISEILKKVHISHSYLPDEMRELAKPTVIVSLLTKMLRELNAYAESIESINNSYQSQENDILTQGIDWVEVDFNENLMSISNIKDAVSLLRTSSLYEEAKVWAGSVKKKDNNKSLSTDLFFDKKDTQNIFDTCHAFQFAENANTSDMLIIDPIRNLAKFFSDDLPNVVSIGAKGAGKTFTYLQVCLSIRWANFLSKVNQDTKSKIDAEILPWLSSTNLHPSVSSDLAKNRKDCLTNLGGRSDSSFSKTNSKINLALKDENTNWDRFWIDLLLEDLGALGSSLDDFNSWLNDNNKSVIILIDGIEDIIYSPEKDANNNAAVRALLHLPNVVSELQNRRIGVVCFARADYVQSVIRQNLSQFISKYQNFKLEWTPDSFLRLAYWICGKAGVIDATTKDAETSNLNLLLDRLERLWGKKLGRDNSKEANSARWVFAALCDLNGRLQARDLVRFLKFSADAMLKAPSNGIKTELWGDRILAPEAIRRSLQSCSEEKVEEAEKEIRPLEQWIINLKAINSEYKKVPFNPLEVGLDLALLNSLKELGVIYEDSDQHVEDRFYLPEIYRWGLQFSSSVGGRPRVQALLKRNIGGMPF